MSGQSYERIKARGTEDNGSNINLSAGSTGEREVMLAPMDDAARRFIALVDECYDGNINLFITAYVPQSELYNNGARLDATTHSAAANLQMYYKLENNGNDTSGNSAPAFALFT